MLAGCYLLGFAFGCCCCCCCVVAVSAAVRAKGSRYFGWLDDGRWLTDREGSCPVCMLCLCKTINNEVPLTLSLIGICNKKNNRHMQYLPSLDQQGTARRQILLSLAATINAATAIENEKASPTAKETPTPPPNALYQQQQQQQQQQQHDE